MLLIKLWNCLRGYVIIKIVGLYTERLINQAAFQGLYLWDVRRIEENALLAKVSVKGFLKLRPLARKTRCRIYILQKKGLYFALNRLKRRKVLLAGVVFFVAAVYLLSSVVWRVEVNVQNEVLKNSVLKDLEQWGLKPGVFKYNLDKKYFLDKILHNYKNVSWAEIEIRGSRVIVELVERDMPPEVEEGTPCHVVADKDGIIYEVLPLRGEALVKPGDTVSKGDVLISGRVSLTGGDGEEKELLVRAKGIVKARVWYRESVEVPLVETVKTYTGRVKRAYKIRWGSKELRFQLGDVKFSSYEEEDLKAMPVLPQALGNVSFTPMLYKEVREESRFLGVEGASLEAERRLEEWLKALPEEVEIVQKRAEFTLNPEKQVVIGTLTVEVIENIGIEKDIE
ncbi:MAG: sporulation protein YqfD [Bacillota bacterium]